MPDIVADLVVVNAGELATLAGGVRYGKALKEPAIIPNGAVAAYRGRIVAVGPTPSVLNAVVTSEETQVIDAGGRAVVPGFVDPHSHLCFAGDRANEFVMRLQGASYMEIAAAGGGITATVKATRAASEAELVKDGLKRLNAMACVGTTTVEAKSGYGLTILDELKMLRAIRTMADQHPLDVVPTFLGAHEIAPEFRQDSEGYVRLLCEEMLPAVAQENTGMPEELMGGRERLDLQQRPLAVFCDVFTEQGVFSVAQSRRVLMAARNLGFRLKVHADELSDLGGAALAAELGAISADHLLYASDKSLEAMSHAGTIAVCLPGTAFCLMNTPYANARRMVELGLAVALATDFNPGSCPVYSMPFVMALACLKMGLDPAEALAASTINAAAAIGLADMVGSLEVGKQADMVLLDAPSYRHIPYRLGQGIVASVIKRGQLLLDKGRPMLPLMQ